VLLLGAWTLVLVRMLCARATIRLRTILTYVLFGALVGPAVIPVLQKFVAPYGWSSESPLGRLLPPLAVGIGSEALLLLPVLAFLLRRRTHRATSAQDAFLLAFSVGFGYELLNRVLFAAAATQKISGLRAFPPWEWEGNGIVVASNPYWLGLPALILFAALRLRRSRPLAFALSAAGAAVAGTERAMYLLAPGLGWPALLRRVTVHGAAYAWVTLILLVLLGLLEERWVGRKSGSPVHGVPALNELGELLKALSSGNASGFSDRSASFRLARQSRIVEAERADRDGDLALAKLNEAVAAAAHAPASSESGASAWMARHKWQAAITLLGFGVAILLPVLPARIAASFWALPLVHAVVLGPVTLIALLPLTLIAWRYLVFPRRPFPPGDPDERLRFWGENAILQGALGLVVLILVYGRLPELYWAEGMPSDPARMTTVVLSLAAAITAVTVRRAARWATAPMAARRDAAVARCLSFAVALAGTWCCLVLFTELQALLHAHAGGPLFRLFGRNGNSAGDTLLAVLAIGFSYGVFRLLLSAASRVRRFFGSETKLAA
jgi:hypothetical protein